MAGIPFLRGARLQLRPLDETDVAGGYPAWLNDPEVCAGNSHHVFPYGAEAALDYVRSARNRRDALILAIERLEDGVHIGNIALQDIHPVYRSAEFAIMLGEADTRGQGYGREAGLLLLDHGFNALNLHRIACGTFENNAAMLKLAAALGMRREGRRRKAAFKQGRYLDIVEFGVLADEYRRFRQPPRS